MPRDYYTTKEGYEEINGNDKINGEWINVDKGYVHRLSAIAWFGVDAVNGREIHHRLNIPWLNVESNLEPIRQPEHSVLTADRIRNGNREQIMIDVLEGLGA